MTIHWAPDDLDESMTGCNMLVGYVLAETEDEVTRTASEADCKDCQEFLDAAEEAANKKVYGKGQ